MVEYRHQDLSGSVFEDVDLSGALFHNVLLRGATIRGAWAERLVVDGGFEELVLNGIDVVPLWRAELARQHPEFSLLTPDDADGYRVIWPVLEEQWAGTVARARALPEELLHERVDGEWSFIQTLRHMLFVHDAWLRRTLLHDPDPCDPLDLPHDEMPDLDGVPNEPDVRPCLNHVLVLREERLAIARRFFAELGDDLLATETAVTGPGYPEAGTYAVTRCLNAVLDEEWWHRRFAERDLAVLEARRAG
jgi:DinB superfamily/Pentapeptide repeats (8 copies)